MSIPCALPRNKTVSSVNVGGQHSTARNGGPQPEPRVGVVGPILRLCGDICDFPVSQQRQGPLASRWVRRFENRKSHISPPRQKIGQIKCPTKKFRLGKAQLLGRSLELVNFTSMRRYLRFSVFTAAKTVPSVTKHGT